MNIGIITLFPEMFTALEASISGRAIRNKIITLQCWQLRDFATDKHKTVDDKPYGGGPGMLMKVSPLLAAITTAKQQLGPNTKTIYLSPQGKTFTQQAAQKLAAQKSLLFIAGRYEGIDERLIESTIDEEWSIGDYVLTGGELAAMVMIDAMVRLLHGALGDAESAEQDSFSQSLLDYPHYTRPEEINGLKVPVVLLSGDHAAIARWRRQQALGRTWQRRPELLSQLKLSAEDQQLLNDFIKELSPPP